MAPKRKSKPMRNVKQKNFGIDAPILDDFQALCRLMGLSQNDIATGALYLILTMPFDQVRDLMIAMRGHVEARREGKAKSLIPDVKDAQAAVRKAVDAALNRVAGRR